MTGNPVPPGRAVYTTADLAAELQVQPRTITRYARAAGVGMMFGRRGGYRFTEEERLRLYDYCRVEKPVARKRRRAA